MKICQSPIFCLLAVSFLPLWSAVLPQERPRVEYPQAGEVLQGVVTIRGTTRTVGFVSAQVAFRYDDPEAETWFVIHTTQQAVDDDVLAVWDTTTITDGDYQLRITVDLKDGRQLTTEVPALRVRNYSAVQPEPVTVQPGTSERFTLDGMQAPAVASTLTATVVAPNPLQITPQRLAVSLMMGLAGAVVLFAGIGLYLGIRAVVRRR